MMQEFKTYIQVIIEMSFHDIIEYLMTIHYKERKKSMKTKLLAYSLALFSLYNATGMTTHEINKKFDDLDTRITALEKKLEQKEFAQEEQKEFIKCNTQKKACKRIPKRKFKRLRKKPIDSNNPTTLAVLKNGKIHPVHRSKGSHQGYGRKIYRKR